MTTKSFLYENVLLKGEGHCDLIKLKAKREEEGVAATVRIDERRLGTIPILTNLDWNGKIVYEFYKEKEEIGQAFDAIKDELENDKACLGDDDGVRGYFFVSFLSLYLYFRVVERIRTADLTSKLPVNELPSTSRGCTW